MKSLVNLKNTKGILRNLYKIKSHYLTVYYLNLIYTNCFDHIISFFLVKNSKLRDFFVISDRK